MICVVFQRGRSKTFSFPLRPSATSLYRSNPAIVEVVGFDMDRFTALRAFRIERGVIGTGNLHLPATTGAFSIVEVDEHGGLLLGKNRPRNNAAQTRSPATIGKSEKQRASDDRFAQAKRPSERPSSISTRKETQ